MATEEEKKRNLVRLTGIMLYGAIKGLWDLLGESAFAIGTKTGEDILVHMEKSMGLEIAGEDPQDILNEIARIFVDEMGSARKVECIKEGNTVRMTVEGCVLLPVTQDLIRAGIQPFMCPYANVVRAAMQARLGVKARISQADVNVDERKSTFVFELL